jgi:hypothetical protein
MNYSKDLEALKRKFDDVKDSPWSMYNNITFEEVIEVYNERGFKDASEYIRRSDISAYRAEEAACGNI